MSELIKNTCLFNELADEAKDRAYSEWIEYFEHPAVDEVLNPVIIIEEQTDIVFDYWDVNCEGYIFKLECEPDEIKIKQIIEHLTALNAGDRFCSHKSSELFVKTLKETMNASLALKVMFEAMVADLVQIYSYDEFKNNWALKYYFYDHGTISGVRGSATFAPVATAYV